MKASHSPSLIIEVLELPKRQKHTTGGIPRWSPTLVLVARFSAYVWQSGRDAQFSLTYGRMCWWQTIDMLYQFDSLESCDEFAARHPRWQLEESHVCH
jgi:hypothetical protein